MFPHDRPLWMQFANGYDVTHYGLIRYSADRRSMFYAWRCLQRSKQPSLGIG
jgi:hypothetical protein